jgi:hypothetical protein
MANRNRIKQGDSIPKQNPNTPPTLLSLSRNRSMEKNDDLIVTLSDAYENRRARQVGEWERLYGQNVYRAF